jgi:hypothetical protein
MQISDVIEDDKGRLGMIVQAIDRFQANNAEIVIGTFAKSPFVRVSLCETYLPGIATSEPNELCDLDFVA